MPSFLSINTPPEGGLDSLGLAHLSAGFEAGKTPKCGCVMPLLMISRHRETWRDWLLPQAPSFSRGVMTSHNFASLLPNCVWTDDMQTGTIPFKGRWTMGLQALRQEECQSRIYSFTGIDSILFFAISTGIAI